MGGVGEIIGAALIAAGAVFFLVGAIGLYRMPDVFTRMHATGISDTMGAGLLLVGMIFVSGFSLVSVKLAVILGVILFTSPIATHALAQAVLSAGIKPVLADDVVLQGPGTSPPRKGMPEKTGDGPRASKTSRRARAATAGTRRRPQSKR